MQQQTHVERCRRLIQMQEERGRTRDHGRIDSRRDQRLIRPAALLLRQELVPAYPGGILPAVPGHVVISVLCSPPGRVREHPGPKRDAHELCTARTRHQLTAPLTWGEPDPLTKVALPPE